MNYSDRIQSIIQLLEPGQILADIGCDHGYVSIGAAQKKFFPLVIAADVQPGPLSRAEAAIAAAGMSDIVHTRLSDGFQKIHEPVDAAVICGMGGLLIRDILEQGREHLPALRQLILGPHSDIPALREYLLRLGLFETVSETVLKDAGKFYVLMKLKRSTQNSEPRNELQSEAPDAGSNSEPVIPRDLILMYGDPQLQTDPRAYKAFLHFRKRQLESILKNLKGETGEHAKSTVQELQAKLEGLNNLLGYLK